MRLTRWVVCIAAIVVAWGAAVDIREALSTRKILSQIDDMDTTIGQMEDFNNTLRSQRHDFLNHLQVVYSLIEMQEYEEANAYIDKVYGAITSVSRVIKTANPAINALLTVKSAACEKAGYALWDVAPGTYAVFDCLGTDGDCISDTWSRFYKEFLPQMGYEADQSTDYEIYFEHSRPGLFCELWIPVKKK